jgi:hypothetical protein
MGQVRGWDKKKKEYIIVNRPAIVEKYNTFMGGVDLMDSLTALCSYCSHQVKGFFFQLD